MVAWTRAPRKFEQDAVSRQQMDDRSSHDLSDLQMHCHRPRLGGGEHGHYRSLGGNTPVGTYPT